MRRQAGFFDVDDRLKRLSDLGDQLEAFEAAVDFEAFRPELNAALAYSDGTQGGRPPFDPVMMFKILVIQTTNNLSDERAEFLINDRLSFMRFLGFGLSDREGAPDAESDPARQQRQIKNLFARRACLRRAEGSDGFVHPNHRDRESEDEDRTGEPRHNIKRLLFLRRIAAA